MNIGPSSEDPRYLPGPLLSDRRNYHRVSKMILFLDTPRATEGLNHRFFVASPENCAESEIKRYAQSARRSLAGADYIAVTRTALQVSRGQARNGRELLVLADISTRDPTSANMLRNRLNEMLNSMPDAPIPVDNPSAGMLVPSRQLAAFERELRGEFSLADTPLKSRIHESGRSGKRPSQFMLFAAMAIIAVIIGAAWQKWHNRDSGGLTGSEDNTGQTTANARNEGNGSNPSGGTAHEGDGDWGFLRTDNDWRILANLCGLKSTWRAEDAKGWALELLREAETDSSRVAVREVSADDFKRNNDVNELLAPIRTFVPAGQGTDPDSLSEEWINLRGNEGQALSAFWNALKGPNGKQKVSAIQLKKLLVKWELAMHTLKMSDQDAVKGVNLSQQPRGGAEIRILVKADLKRFEAIQNFLMAGSFLDELKKAGYDNWESRTWKEKLQLIPGMGSSSGMNKDTREFCKSLDAAVKEMRNPSVK
jgi:hypothetical protein